MTARVVHLNPLRQRIVDALLSGKRVQDIAADLGCDRTTVWRTKRDPDVALLLMQRTSDRLADAAASRDEDVVDAMAYVGDVACGRVPGDQTRLTAAKEIIARSPLAAPLPDATAQERERRALAAACAGGEEAVIKHIGEAVAAAWGFGKVGA